ncbi:prophage tail fiber C-terminus family protein [Escherichia coli]|uniref:Prophage tail fiber C-terminus family protein n=7 Tax=Escherichia coli TaxID=562 RepID=A0A376ZGF7_ECOLX|nr:prophage tail fiber C-terminus family protein [Escherichia coli]
MQRLCGYGKHDDREHGELLTAQLRLGPADILESDENGIIPEQARVITQVVILDADKKQIQCKRLARTVLIFTERSDQLSRATDRVPGLPANPGYAQ